MSRTTSPTDRAFMNPPASTRGRRMAVRGFSLIELLVVIGIIAILTSLLVPGLIAARNAARKASTSALINSVSSATSQYQNDNDGATPGYFTAREMGDPANAVRGMTMNENIILGLAGDRAIADPGANPVLVGPTGNSDIDIEIDINKIGLGDSYLKVSPDNLVAVDSSLQQIAGGGLAPPHVDDTGAPHMPEIVDAWERPLLFWVEDQFVSASQISEAAPTSSNDVAFARIDSSDGPALFYWNSNAAYLRGSQADSSLLGADTDDARRLATMRALLGNPGYASSLDPADANTMFPSAARNGGFVIQSAGVDGFYLGFDDRATNLHGEGAVRGQTSLEFRNNFFNDGQRLLEDDREITIDQIADYDDVIGG